MITSSKEVDSQTKEECNANDGNKTVKASTSSTTPWLRFKDPRIVRVSRAFGGKDRHSKVCTIRGLRDRRVRLSVPTAIQLYDLQDRLGLNQPSKVVDWLLNAAKHEIDELPPLPMLPGSFAFNHQAMLNCSHEIGASQSNKEGFKINNSINWEDPSGFPRPNFWSGEAANTKSKEIARDSVNIEKENWGRNEEDNQENSQGSGAQVSSSNFLTRGAGDSSVQGLINNAIPYSSFFPLEHQNLPLSHLGSHGFASQNDDPHNLNLMPLPSTLSLSSGGSQILLCPPGPPGATQSYFPSQGTDPRQISNFQMMMAASTQNLLQTPITSSQSYPTNQSMRPFHFRMTPRVFNPYNSENQPDKANQE